MKSAAGPRPYSTYATRPTGSSTNRRERRYHAASIGEDVLANPLGVRAKVASIPEESLKKSLRSMCVISSEPNGIVESNSRPETRRGRCARVEFPVFRVRLLFRVLRGMPMLAQLFVEFSPTLFREEDSGVLELDAAPGAGNV